jgi:phytanoyl-CoA hydroxylase
MQSLIFDVSRETLAHHDAYYLDTDPAGNAIAVWIALEDIDERAGIFYVVPKSTNVHSEVERPDMTHWEWMSTMHKYWEANLKEQIFAPALKKGDALFWNSRLIHGALPILDPRFSRKSLTAHFIPSEYKHQTPFMTKEYMQCEPYKGVNMYTATVINSSEWATKQMTH